MANNALLPAKGKKKKKQGKDQPASDVKGTAGNEVFHHSP